MILKKRMYSVNDNAITLIALVITIVILLIIAAISIGVLTNGGIVGKAEEALAKHNETIKNQQAQLDVHDEMLDDIYGIVKKPKEWGENPNIGIIQTDEGDKIPIPSGFVQVLSEGNSIHGGIVITDGTNEFVWVPCSINGVGGKVSCEKWTSPITEIPSEEATDDLLPTKITSTWGQSETSQIEKYKGFYVARYEAGIPENLTSAINNANKTNRDVLGKPLSKKNSVPWNYISYTKAKTNAESMYSSTYMQSALISGRQWDVIIKWMENSGNNVQTNSSSWGNYDNIQITGITQYSSTGAVWENHTTKPANYNYILKTGHTNYTKVNNIYDIAGNLWEWSSENYYSSKVDRGGSCANEGNASPAGVRSIFPTDTANYVLGFRVVLYLV
jgi:type II secretory pathway pseudopilin PulG